MAPRFIPKIFRKIFKSKKKIKPQLQPQPNNAIHGRVTIYKDIVPGVKEARRAVICVLKNINRKSWNNIFWPVIFIALFMGSALYIAKHSRSDLFLANMSNTFSLKEIDKIIFEKESKNQKFERSFKMDLDRDGKTEIFKIIARYAHAETGVYGTDLFSGSSNGDKLINPLGMKVYGSSLGLSRWDSGTNYGELLLLRSWYIGKPSTFFYRVGEDEGFIHVPIVEDDGVEYQALGDIKEENFMKLPDGSKVIYYYYVPSISSGCEGKGGIYKLHEGRLIKMFDLRETQEWCRNFIGG